MVVDKQCKLVRKRTAKWGIEVPTKAVYLDYLRYSTLSITLFEMWTRNETFVGRTVSVMASMGDSSIYHLRPLPLPP